MTMRPPGLDLLVRRDNLRELVADEGPPAEALVASLEAGNALFRVDTFGFSANNVTYATLGDAFSYFSFFPARDGYARIPVWGFGDVIASRCPEIPEGARYYGFFPISRYLAMSPARVTDGGFVDGAPHRASLHAIYNQYARTSADPGYRPETEALQMLLRPLFTTSFLLDDFLAESAFFGARTVIFSSASSKTAYGAAFLLHARATRPELVGLTSAANADFVRQLGVYDRVLTYDEVDALEADAKSVYVDLAGNSRLRSAVHHRLGDALVYSCAVGGTHWDQRGATQTLPGAAPTLFFAPAQAKLKVAAWGPKGFGERLGAAWRAFVAKVTARDGEALTITRGHGVADVTRVYLDLVDGRGRPSVGHVLSV